MRFQNRKIVVVPSLFARDVCCRRVTSSYRGFLRNRCTQNEKNAHFGAEKLEKINFSRGYEMIYILA